MLFALDICVNKKAPPTHSVHWGLSPPQKHQLLFFLPNLLLNLQTIQALLLRHFASNILIFHAPPPPKNRIFQWTPILLKFFIFNPIPSFKSN